MPPAPASSPAPSPAHFPLVAALGLTQIIGFGSTFYILAVLAEPMARDLGLPRGLVLGGMSIWLAVSAVLGPRLGRWQDEQGARRVMVCGSLLQGVGLGLLALAKGAISYALGWVVLGLAAPLALYSAAFTALTQVDATRARRSISALTFFGGFASTVFWPLTSWLTGQMDWRSILLLYAGLNVMICLPIHALMLGEAKGTAHASAGGEFVPPGMPHEAQTVAFLLFAGMLMVQALVFYAVTTLVFPMLGAFGYAGAGAVFIASLIGPAQVAARIADMLAATRVSALLTGLISAWLLPLGFLAVLALPAGLAAGILFALFYGMSNGLLTVARGGITLSIFGSIGYGERLNRVMVPQNILGAVAPVLGGMLMDHAGADALAPLLLVLALISALLMSALKIHCARAGLK